MSVAISEEADIVAVRRRARQLAKLLGFDAQDQTRIATAVSEIARNALVYAGGGRTEFVLENSPPQSLVIRVTDRGPGIPNLRDVLSGRYQSNTGMGIGIVGTRRLMDGFEIESAINSGTNVQFWKQLPKSAQPVGPSELASVADRLVQEPQDFYGELRQQNQELLASLDALQERQEDLVRLNRELEDTNRGVVALYAELDERAERLRLADQMKSRFLSHMSHEFRTPLNSITGLTRLLLRRPEIAASPDTAREIQYIQRSSEELAELVNDLLDLAKVEAGKLSVQPSEFSVQKLFGALRTMMRPLLTNEAVELTFEDAEIPPLLTDETKVAQIIRNFVSNALKFTDRGSVRVTAVYAPADDTVRFSVADTGIGIAPENLARIFEEFSQIDSPTQRRVKGTGLGLPLCRRLAELLGGEILLESSPGAGSTFTAIIPRVLGTIGATTAAAPSGRCVLLIDDEEVSRYLLKGLLREHHDLEIIEAASGAAGIEKIRQRRPDLVFLDLRMPGMNGVEVLGKVRQDPAMSATPVVIVTSQMLGEAEQKELTASASAVLLKDVLAKADALNIDFGPPVSVHPRFGEGPPVEGTSLQ